MARICNDAGLAIIKEFESCCLTAYLDQKGILTIGWGHTNGVTEGMTIDQQQADDLLYIDLMSVESGINRLVKPPISDNQFAALCSLSYNIGLGAFSSSSALQFINEGMFAQVPASIMRWDKITIDGKLMVDDGLVRRRAAECRLWNTPDMEDA